MGDLGEGFGLAHRGHHTLGAHLPIAKGVQGSRFRVQGSEFRVQGSGFRVQGSGLLSKPITPTIDIALLREVKSPQELQSGLNLNNTVEYDPGIKSRLASRNYLKGLLWCSVGHVTLEISSQQNPQIPSRGKSLIASSSGSTATHAASSLPLSHTILSAS